MEEEENQEGNGKELHRGVNDSWLSAPHHSRLNGAGKSQPAKMRGKSERRRRKDDDMISDHHRKEDKSKGISRGAQEEEGDHHCPPHG